MGVSDYWVVTFLVIVVLPCTLSLKIYHCSCRLFEDPDRTYHLGWHRGHCCHSVRVCWRVGYFIRHGGVCATQQHTSSESIHARTQLYYTLWYYTFLPHDFSSGGQAVPGHVLPCPATSWIIFLAHLRGARDKNKPDSKNSSRKQKENYDSKTSLHERMRTGCDYVHDNRRGICHYNCYVNFRARWL